GAEVDRHVTADDASRHAECLAGLLVPGNGRVGRPVRFDGNERCLGADGGSPFCAAVSAGGAAGGRPEAQARCGNHSAIARAADSGESEPCTTLSRLESERSPRMVPGAATRPSVAPLSARTTSIAWSPSSTSATSGPEVTKSRNGG